MELKSPAFENGGKIPSRFTCDGADVSPALEISGVPEGTATLALVMDDPDAPGGTFDHWLVWNIPPQTASIPEGTEPQGVQGRTGFGKPGYGGPCPPGGTHRYRFKLYALDQALDLKAGSRKAQLEGAMKGHVLAEALLQGTYARQR
jgi:Raf kinase inhibitor-like YbhB/YbcL family protein